MSDVASAPPAEAAPEAAAAKPAKAKDAPAKKAKSSEAKGKGKGKGSKGEGKGKGKKASGDGLSVASHPRASASVRQAKGWGGLLAFGITAYLSLSHGVSPDLAGLRALGAGIAGYVVSWGCAVAVWRQLMVAELRARIEAARPQPAPEQLPAGNPDQPAPAQT
jgi:hypothetical protein